MSLDYMDFFPKKEFYTNQKEAMDTIYKSLTVGKVILFEGACGTGKTLSALAPSLAIAKEKGKKVIIATPFHQQMNQFIEEAKEIKQKTDINVVSFVGKEIMCPMNKSNAECDGLTSNTYTLIDINKHTKQLREEIKKGELNHNVERLTDRATLTKDLITNEYTLSRLTNYSCKYLYEVLSGYNDYFKDWLFKSVRSPEEVKEYSYKQGKCGYELLKKQLKEADLIICNYHHLIKPELRDRFLTMIGCELSDLIIIFDEAHNLESQAKQSQLDPLSELVIESAIKETSHIEDNNGKAIKLFLILLQVTFKQSYEQALSDNKGKSAHSIEIQIRNPKNTNDKFIQILKNRLQENGYDFDKIIIEAIDFGLKIEKKMEEHYINGKTDACRHSALLEVAVFMKKYSELSTITNYYPVLVLEKNNSRSYGVLELCNCIPTTMSGPLLNGPYGAILISATLKPFDITKNILGIEKDTVEISYGLSFPRERRKTLIVDVGPITWETRDTPNMEETIKKILEDIIESSDGNVLIFFQTYEQAKKYSKIVNVKNRIFVPEKGKTPEEIKNEFFKIGDSGGKAVMMTYLWGQLTEGVDYKDDRCRTVVVVGVGLPQYKNDRMQAEINAYDHIFGPGKGFEYAVSNPTVRKIRQANGRVIRAPLDFGIRVLIDSRYTKSFKTSNPKYAYYQKFPPEDREEFEEVKPDNLKTVIYDFFKDKKKIISVRDKPQTPNYPCSTGNIVSIPNCGNTGTHLDDSNEYISSLLKKLNDDDEFSRMKIASILGTMKDTQAVEPLIKVAQYDKVIDVRINAIKALGDIGDKKAMPVLLSLLTNEIDRYIRKATVNAIISIRDPGSIQHLIKLLENYDPYVRISVLNILGEISDISIYNYVNGLVDDNNSDVRATAKEVLKKLK